MTTDRTGEVVFVKIGTTGRQVYNDRIVELAAVAADAKALTPGDSLYLKVEYDDDVAPRDNLRIEYGEGIGSRTVDPEWWSDEAHVRDERGAMTAFAQFLRNHASVKKMSSVESRPIVEVARILGHGVGRFEFPFIRQWFSNRRVWLPADLFALDTLHAAALGSLGMISTAPYVSFVAAEMEAFDAATGAQGICYAVIDRVRELVEAK
jgi:hypothetical protein